MAYRPPYDWTGLLDFLEPRLLLGVETVEGGAYARTVRLGDQVGWLRVTDEAVQSALKLEISPALTPVLPQVLSRLRHLLDLDARLDIIANHLGQDDLLAAPVLRNPGLRVPGAFDGLELAVRAILGQQVTVKGAATLTARFVARFGEQIGTPVHELSHIAPTAEQIASASIDEIAALGIVGSRSRTIVAVADEVASWRLSLKSGANPEETMQKLLAIRGIGP